jgi:hypothetical protein
MVAAAVVLVSLATGCRGRDHGAAVNAYLADFAAARCEAAQGRLAPVPEASRTEWIAHCTELTTDALGRATLARTTWKITGVRADSNGGARVDVSWTSPDVQREFTTAFQESVEDLAKDVNDILSGEKTGSADPFEKNHDAMVARIESGEVKLVTSLFVFDVRADGRISSAPIPAP